MAENVLRRAIELHHEEQFGGGTIDVATVQQIGAELGIRADVIRRAMLEELQTDHHHSDGWLDRLLGPDRVSGGMVTRAEADALDRQVEEWMRRHEGLRPRAKSGRAVRWEKDPGLGTALRRGLRRTQGTGVLRSAPLVITRQTEVGPREQLIEIDADTSRVKGESAAIGVAGALGAVAVGAGVAAAGTFAPDAVEFVAGFLPAIGATAVAMTVYARHRIARIKNGINRALDGILNPELVRGNEDRRRRGRRPTWARMVEEIADDIFD